MLLTICWVKEQTLELYGEKWRTCSLYLTEPRREVDPVEARLLPSMHFIVFWFPNCVHIKYPQSNNSLLLDGEKLKNLVSQLFQIKGFIWEHCWMVSRRAPPDRKQSHHHSQHHHLFAGPKKTAWVGRAVHGLKRLGDHVGLLGRRDRGEYKQCDTDIEQFRFYTIMTTKWDWFRTELSSLYCFYLKRKCIDYNPPRRFILPDIKCIHNLF